MSKKNLSIIVLSGVLTFSAVPSAFSQSSQPKAANPAPTQKTPEQSRPSDQRDKSSTSEQMHKDMAATQDSIKQAQQALKTQGLYKGGVDGKSSAEFESALRAYQTQNQLQATGKLDSQTMAKLGLTSGHNPKKDSAAPAGTKPQPKSPDARQKPSDMPAAPVTADPDNPRDNPPVVTPRQQPPDRVEPDIEHRTAVPSATPGAIEQTPKTGEQTPKTGEGNASTAEDIRQVQMALKNRGFDPGEINGMISSQTQKAIKDFQTANNLPVSGNVDQRTLAALGVKIKNPDKKPNLSFNSLGRWGALNQVAYQTSFTQPRATLLKARMELQSSAPPQEVPKAKDQDKKDKADSKADKPAKVDDDLVKRIEKAGEVVQSLTGAEDKRIPDEMLQRAEGIVVIPNMIKGAFGIGGRYGKGIVAKRLANGQWSAPAFVAIGGGSFGAQLGVSSTDLVLVFTDKQAFEALSKNLTLKLGADAGVVAGPLGRSGEAGVTHDLKSGIYAYSRSKGLFAGIALDGAVIDMDKENNRDMYGANAAAASILSDASLTTNSHVHALVEALDRVAPLKPSK